MGYKVKISYSEDAQRLCRLLSESPAEVFDKPFFGYLLFLLTGNEKQLILELSRQFGEFESLSRDTFAYVLVANEASIPIDDVRWEPAAYERHVSRNALPIQREKVGLSYIKNSGIASFGYMFNKSDRGELLAMSDAVNEIARWFGVTPKLPCILAFDAIPQENPTIIPIDQFTTDNLIKLFRNVVGRISGPKYREHIKKIQELGRLNENLETSWSPQEPTIEGIQSEQLQKLKRYSDSLAFLTQRLLDGSTKGETLQRLSDLALPSAAKEAAQIAVVRTHGLRKKLSDALRSVDRCAASIGTDAEEEIKPKRVFRRTIAPLLPVELTLEPPVSVADWLEVKSCLQRQLALEVETVLSSIPSALEMGNELNEHVEAEFSERLRLREEFQLRVISTEEQRERLLKEFLSFSFPSFSAILQDELGRAGQAYIVQNMQANIKNWVTKPATVKWLTRIIFESTRRAIGM